jgi:Protein of unknown function (DUF2815)
MSTNQPIGRITLKDVRLAFPSVFEATTVNGEGDPKYKATLVLPPDHPQLAEVKAKMQAIAKDKWKDKGAATYTSLEKIDKLALHDGDTKSQYDGFAGNFFISASAQETARPTVVNADRTPLTAKDGVLYAGCYVNVLLEFWPQDNKYGKRINAQLRGVQFLRDGDSFSAGRPADGNEFDAVEGADAAEFA